MLRVKPLCILETPKPVLWQTVKTQMKCSMMKAKTTLGTEIHHNLESFTYDP